MLVTDSFLISLSQITSNQLEVVGSKAANLAHLLKGGYPVPEGFVITTMAYEAFLTQNNLEKIIENSLKQINYDDPQSLKEQSRLIQNAFEKAIFPIQIEKQIKNGYLQKGLEKVAVRSSATAEDLPKSSFAGQYDTYLNLKSPNQVMDHVKKCYASLWTKRAMAYRYANNIPHDKVKIAVITQSMVPAKCAGLLFTMNPISFNEKEIVIESNYGLGESIVSGKCCPDQYTLLRGGKKGKVSFVVMNQRIGTKNICIEPKKNLNEHGVDLIQLSEEKSKSSSLEYEQLLHLAEIGVHIEQIFNGIPQDIEWAIDENDQIIPLQSRPITILKSKAVPDDVIWSRGYSDDYWNDNVTPLYFELLGDQLTKVVNIELNSIMGYKKMDANLLKLFRAHVYFNLKVLKKKVENEIPSLMRNNDLLNYFPEGSGPYGKETVKKLPFHVIQRIVAELRIMLFDPNGSITKTADVYDEWTKKEFVPYLKTFDEKLKKISASGDMKLLIELARELDEVMVSHFRLVRYGIPVHNIGMNLLVQYLMMKFLGKKRCQKYYPILISGLNNKLTETNEQVHYLASIVNAKPKLKKLILENPSNSIYKLIISENDPEIKNFVNIFKDFLEKFGDRGFTRETYYPRWKEPPMTNLFDILKSLITDEWEELEKLKEKNIRKKFLIERYVKSKIRSQKLGFLKWKILSIILNFSRRYIIFRENQRFNLDRWISRNRNIYLEIGKLLRNTGLIDIDNKVFFLWKKEIEKIAKEKYNNKQMEQLSLRIEKRFIDFKQNENILPPKFLVGSREFNDTLQFDFNSNIFYGIPASQGYFKGKVRVLNDIDEISSVKKGEILIVPRTDPGWTPVFSKIGGLITETGGVLSHGAVVSREYGIPAVTNITNACRIFTTGQSLILNGYEGIVKCSK